MEQPRPARQSPRTQPLLPQPAGGGVFSRVTASVRGGTKPLTRYNENNLIGSPSAYVSGDLTHNINDRIGVGVTGQVLGVSATRFDGRPGQGRTQAEGAFAHVRYTTGNQQDWLRARFHAGVGVMHVGSRFDVHTPPGEVAIRMEGSHVVPGLTGGAGLVVRATDNLNLTVGYEGTALADRRSPVYTRPPNGPERRSNTQSGELRAHALTFGVEFRY